MRPNYTILSETKNLIIIKDLYSDENPSMTVTNGAEQVIEELRDRPSSYVFKNQRVLYYDSEGELDELQHDGRKFIGFNILDEHQVRDLLNSRNQ